MKSLAKPREWDPDRRARELMGRRDELIRRLPRTVHGAAALSDDVRESIVVEAIEFAAMRHEDPIATARDLERVFWDACHKRVLRARENRYDLVRGHHIRVSDDALASVAGDADPAAEAERAEERELIEEFAATLKPRERRVLRCKYFSGTAEPLGHRRIAKRLGITLGAALAAERVIARSVERFSEVYTAGRLCPTRESDITALAAGVADPDQANLARLHVVRCPHCKPLYVAQVRELRSAAFARKVAAILPAAPDANDRSRSVRGAWDALLDTLTRPFGHDATAAAAQLAASGAGRGVGTIAVLKIAGACMASASAVGVCATTFVAPVFTDGSPAKTASHPTAKRKSQGPVGRHERIPTRAEQQLTPTPTPTPKPARRQAQRDTAAAAGATQGGTGPTSHEETPASPAPSNAAPDGASEFDPNHQPSEPPAPAPAAPGANEFF